MKSCLWFSAAASLWLTLGATAAERVALVVGCNAYQAEGLALDTPVNDAHRMAALLRTSDLGFEVIEATDPTLRDFSRALAKFKEQAAGAKVALLYYSGHGLEVDGENYLLPVDAELDQAAGVEAESVGVSRVLQQMAASKAEAKILILDCCRNNPFAVTKSWAKTKSVRDAVLRELGEAEIPDTTLVCFATGAGRKAAAVIDEASKNSPFTDSLLRHLQTPRANVLDVFAAVHKEIDLATGGRQRPAVKTDNAISPVLRELVLYRGNAPAPLPPMTAPVAPPVTPGGNKSKMSIVTPTERFNADLTQGRGDEDQLIYGVKKRVTYTTGFLPGQEPFMDVKIAGIEAPAQLAFLAIPPNYPIALALRFPTLRRTCSLPQSFYDGFKGIIDESEEGLAPGYKMQAAMYDFDADGVPELVIAANKWDDKDKLWDVGEFVRVMVYSFHVPATSTELDNSANWRLCGTVEGQFVSEVDEDRLILPIGSSGANDHLFKNGRLLEGEGTGRDASGRWAPGQYKEHVPAPISKSALPPSSPRQTTKSAAPSSLQSAAGTWKVVEKVFPKHGGYLIEWRYLGTVTGGSLDLQGQKLLVNKKNPTAGEAKARSYISIPGAGPTATGSAREINFKGQELISTMYFTFDASFTSFRAQNYEGQELVSELTGTKATSAGFRR